MAIMVEERQSSLKLCFKRDYLKGVGAFDPTGQKPHPLLSRSIII